VLEVYNIVHVYSCVEGGYRTSRKPYKLKMRKRGYQHPVYGEREK